MYLRARVDRAVQQFVGNATYYVLDCSGVRFNMVLRTKNSFVVHRSSCRWDLKLGQRHVEWRFDNFPCSLAAFVAACSLACRIQHKRVESEWAGGRCCERVWGRLGDRVGFKRTNVYTHVHVCTYTHSRVHAHPCARAPRSCTAPIGAFGFRFR